MCLLKWIYNCYLSDGRFLLNPTRLIVAFARALKWLPLRLALFCCCAAYYAPYLSRSVDGIGWSSKVVQFYIIFTFLYSYPKAFFDQTNNFLLVIMITQLVNRCIDIVGFLSSNPVQAWIFLGFLTLARASIKSLINSPHVHIWSCSYIPYSVIHYAFRGIL